MLRRHATPNTISTMTTGITRLFGVQYWKPSSTPTTTVVTNVSTRFTRSRADPTSRRRAAGALSRPIAGPSRDRIDSWVHLRAGQREQPGDRAHVLRERHPPAHVRQHEDRDAVPARLLAGRGRVRAGPGQVVPRFR